jgi:hypothetical protein
MLVDNEKSQISWKNINKVVRKAIMNEGPNRTRILYAGINPEDINTMVVKRVIELFRGKYFFEETIFNPAMQSVHTTISSIAREKFHTVIPATEKLHQIEFFPNPQIIAATSYTRPLGRRVFHDSIIKDTRNNKNWLSPVCDMYVNWSLRRYLNKKI